MTNKENNLTSLLHDCKEGKKHDLKGLGLNPANEQQGLRIKAKRGEI